VLHVDAPSDVITARIHWRRCDPHPEQIGLRLWCVGSGAEVRNMLALSITCEEGTIVFQAEKAGEYHLYYLPCESVGPWYHPETRYRPVGSQAEADWQACAIAANNSWPSATGADCKTSPKR